MVNSYMMSSMANSCMLNAQLLDQLLISLLDQMNLSLNCLFCSHCHCFRSISEYFFHDDGIHLITCIYCQFIHKKQSQHKLQQTQQVSSSQTLFSSQTLSCYCFSCTQLCQLSQFDQFKTCKICHTTNKKVKCQRIQKIQLHNQHRQISLAKSHLQQWVQLTGEEK